MKRAALPLSILAGLALILVTACGGAAPAPSATTAPPTATTGPVATTAPTDGNGGGASEGQVIFVGSGGCAACHTIEGVATGLIGPDLTHIGTDAATRKPELSAEEYITESILDPEAFVATGVERAIPGIMLPALTATLSDAEVAALTGFLLEQK